MLVVVLLTTLTSGRAGDALPRIMRERYLLGLGSIALMALVGCQKGTPTESEKPAAVASAATLPLPVEPPAPPPVQLTTVSWALFKGEEVLTCADVSATADKIAALKPPEGMTVLKQTCDSLGRTALTKCVQGHSVTMYYSAKYSDKYMAGCVKGGGQWTTNKSLQAQQERAEQDLVAAKKAAGIAD